MPRIIALITLASTLAGAEAPLPDFKDYPATQKLTGRPAAPKIVRPADRMYRTMIREGALKGPNFAGHMTIATWGCGSSCVSIALIDAKDGDIAPAPFRALSQPVAYTIYEGRYNTFRDQVSALSYQLDSRLLVVRGCPDEKNCGSYFYEWTGKELRLIKSVPAVPARKEQ